MKCARFYVMLFGVVLVLPVFVAARTSRSGFFTTSDGVRLHYLEAGSGPALVFVPGWTMPADIWETQLTQFSRSYHVVALDPRSQGESDKPADGNYPERRAQDIKELVDHLKLAPAVLVGWSMGVPELLTYVEQFGTSSVRGLVLVDGLIWDQPNPQMAAAVTSWMHDFQRNRQKSTETFVRSMFKKPQAEDYLRRITKASLKTPTNSAVLLIRNVDRESWTPVLTSLAQARTPVLGIFTTQAKGAADLLRTTIPDARVEIFEDAGHAMFVDDPAQFNGVLESFLKSICRRPALDALICTGAALTRT